MEKNFLKHLSPLLLLLALWPINIYLGTAGLIVLTIILFKISEIYKSNEFYWNSFYFILFKFLAFFSLYILFPLQPSYYLLDIERILNFYYHYLIIFSFINILTIFPLRKIINFLYKKLKNKKILIFEILYFISSILYFAVIGIFLEMISYLFLISFLYENDGKRRKIFGTSK